MLRADQQCERPWSLADPFPVIVGGGGRWVVSSRINTRQDLDAREQKLHRFPMASW